MTGKKQTGWHDGGKDNKCFAQKGQCPFGGESGVEGHFPPTAEGKKKLEEYIAEKHSKEKLFEQNNEKKLTPKQQLLQRFPTKNQQLKAAKTKQTSAEDLLLLSTVKGDAACEVLWWLAQNKNTPAEALVNVIEYKTKRWGTEPMLPEIFSNHPNCNEEVVEALARGVLATKCRAAESSLLSDETFLKLTKDDDYLVRVNCMASPKITEEIMTEMLRKENNFEVMAEIAEKTKNPETLNTLLKKFDDDEYVDLTTNEDCSYNVLCNIAANAYTPEEALLKIVNEYKGQYAAASVLSNPRVSAKIIDVLADNYIAAKGKVAYPDMLKDIKNNPQTSMKTLLKLKEYELGGGNNGQ